MPSSPLLCWDFVWLEFVEVLCMLSQSLWVHMCTYPAVSGKQWMKSSTTSASYAPLPPLPHRFLRLEGRGWNIHFLFRAEYADISYSWLIDQMWFSVLIAIYYKKFLGLLRCLSIKGHLLLLLRTQIWFLAHTCCLTIICNSSFRRSSALSCHLRGLYTLGIHIFMQAKHTYQ